MSPFPPSQMVQVNDQISETYHPEVISGQGTRRYVSAPVAITVFATGAAFIIVVSLALRYPISTSLGIYAFLAGPICFAALLSRVIQVSEAIERTVSLNDGNVTVIRSNKTESYPLNQCCWFRGKTTDDLHLAHQSIRKNVLVIVLPTGRTIACGLDDSFYSRWLAVLTASQCRRVLRQEGPLGVLFFALVILGLAAGGFVGWHLGEWLEQILVPQAINKQMANLISTAVSICLAWLIAISPWFIPGWRRYTDRERQYFVRLAIVIPVIMAILAGAFFGGNALAIYVLAGGLAVLFLLISFCFFKNPPTARTAA